MPVIGFLGGESPDLIAHQLRAFRQGLSETGYIEGRNVAIEYRWAEGHNDRLPALAAELVRRQVSVIAATSTRCGAGSEGSNRDNSYRIRHRADPVAVGLVASLNRPGGNFTGVTTLNVELGPKRLELLHELVPTATSIAVLINPTNPLCGDHIERLAGSGPQARATAPCAACEH